MPFEQDPDEIGSLWQKQGARGTYFTGKVLGQQVVVFANGNKKSGSNAPDWRVLKPKPRDEAQHARTVVANSQPLTDDDISF